MREFVVALEDHLVRKIDHDQENKTDRSKTKTSLYIQSYSVPLPVSSHIMEEKSRFEPKTSPI
jgi:hypothetical protein